MGEDVFLLDGGVQLQGELWRGAQEGLDDGRALEGVAVDSQLALRVADLPLHGQALVLLQLHLAADGHVRLLLLPRPEVRHQRLDAPARHE